jgi:hypothetical protein
MPTAHFSHCLIPLTGIGKPVEGFPVIGQLSAERIVPSQAYADAEAFFRVFWNCDQIMRITEHETLYSVRAGVDFRCLLRPNSG